MFQGIQGVTHTQGFLHGSADGIKALTSSCHMNKYNNKTWSLLMNITQDNIQQDF
jgi:hypothetical protein